MGLVADSVARLPMKRPTEKIVHHMTFCRCMLRAVAARCSSVMRYVEVTFYRPKTVQYFTA